jgi:hypothetical protein
MEMRPERIGTDRGRPELFSFWIPVPPTKYVTKTSKKQATPRAEFERLSEIKARRERNRAAADIAKRRLESVIRFIPFLTSFE